MAKQRQKFPILYPGDFFVMKWTKEPPTFYLVLEDLSKKNYSNDLLTDVHQELLGFASDIGKKEEIIVYRSDFEDNVIQIVRSNH